MKIRSSRSYGSLFALFVLAGCATATNPSNQASGSPLSTKDGQAGALIGPPAFAGNAAPASGANSTSLANAEPLTDQGDISGFRQTGRASWYGWPFHGRRTANGERYNMRALTAAHRTLPLGSYVRVTNPDTDRSVIVRINDRGPYARNRVIDLSLAAARALHMQHSGTARVTIQGLTQQEAKAEISETLAENTDK